MPPRKKKPDPDKLNPFERSGKQPYQTMKIPLKTILCDNEALPVLTQLVFDSSNYLII